MEFADRLKKLRKDKQLSQEQLSTKLHVSRQAISKWETGVLPDIENLINIAHFFDCSLDYLVGIEERKLDKKYQSIDLKLKRVEKISLNIIVASVMCLLVLWISSKFINVDFVRQDINGRWYTGFRAFVDNYRLYPLIYVLIILCMIFLNLKCIIGVMSNRKNIKYMIFRISSWVMYMIMFIYWIVDFVDISKFYVVDKQTIILLSIYILLIVLSNLGMYYYERRE